MWGASSRGRGVHLINWEILCLPKEQGGANLKPSKDMNRALMAKLAWRLLKCTGSAWCDTLRKKYGVQAEDGAYFKGRQRSS